MVGHPVLLALVVAVLARPAAAQHAVLVAAAPGVEIRSGGRWRPAVEGMELRAGDVLSTGHRSQALLRFDGPAFVLAGPLTQLGIERHERRRELVETELFLRIGSIRAKARPARGTIQRLAIVSPAGRCDVADAETAVSYAEGFGMRVDVKRGQAEGRAVRNGKVAARPGDALRLEPGRTRGPREVRRDGAALDLMALGSDDSERDATLGLDRAAQRPLADPLTANSLAERAALAAGDASLVFRFEVLTAP